MEQSQGKPSYDFAEMFANLKLLWDTLGTLFHRFPLYIVYWLPLQN